MLVLLNFRIVICIDTYMTQSFKIETNYLVFSVVPLMSQIVKIKIKTVKKSSSQFPRSFILVQPDDGLLDRNMFLN
jgi:hypothetical protein